MLVNHFKSKGYGTGSGVEREAPAPGGSASATIYEHGCATRAHELVAVIGDLNDTPATATRSRRCSAAPTSSDIEPHAEFDSDGRPGTFGNGTASNKIDYILLSPALRERAGASGLFRRGMWPGCGRRSGTPTPRSDPRQGGKEVHAASDHAALWVDLDL